MSLRLGFFTALVRLAELSEKASRAFLFFGGWWVVSANRWFKGPIRMGSEEELERIEAALEGGGAAPATSGD